MSNKKQREGKYKLASSKKWMEKESSGFIGKILKLPTGVGVYQMKAGKSLLDIVPFVAGKGNPNADKGMLYWERSFAVHRNIGPDQSTYVCPARTANKPCPVCEERARIMRNDPDEEEQQLAKDLAPKEWMATKVRDRGADDKGVQVLVTSIHRFSETLRDAVASGDEDENLDSFWHPEGGKTLKVLFKNESMGSNKFVSASTVNFKDRSEDIDEEDIEAFSLDDILIIPDYDKLKDAFFQTAKSKKKKDEDEEDADEDNDSDDSDEDEDEDEEEEEEVKKSSKKGSKSKTKTSSKKSSSSDEESEEDDEDEDDGDGGGNGEDDEENPDDEDEEEEEEEEEKPKKGKSSKVSSGKGKSSKSDSEEDDEDEDDDGDDDSEDDEEDDSDSEDDDDDSDEEDDEEEESDDEDEKPKVKQASKKDLDRAKAKAKSKKKDEEEEEEDDSEEDDKDFDDFDDEEEEEEEEPKKKKK